MLSLDQNVELYILWIWNGIKVLGSRLIWLLHYLIWFMLSLDLSSDFYSSTREFSMETTNFNLSIPLPVALKITTVQILFNGLNSWSKSKRLTWNYPQCLNITSFSCFSIFGSSKFFSFMVLTIFVSLMVCILVILAFYQLVSVNSKWSLIYWLKFIKKHFLLWRILGRNRCW